MESFDKVMDRLDFRAKNRVNLDVDWVSDLQIHYAEQDSSKSKSGYYAKIDGKDMLLTSGAIKTACRLVKISDPTFFNQFEDRDEFPRVLRKGIDEGKRKRKGVLVRHNGLEVTSILAPDYKIKDANELLADFIGPLKENLGEPVGVYSLEQGNGDICDYRIVMGDNLVPELNPEHGQFLMFMLTTSENGLCDTRSILGSYRNICQNSAIREQTLCKWDHKSLPNKFYSKTASTIQQIGFYTDRFSQVFQALVKAKLDVPAVDLVSELKRSKLITKGHAEMALMAAGEPTEDGREHETYYDLFNVLTRGARNLPSILNREQAEQSTLELFSEPGGIQEQLRIAHEKAATEGSVVELE